MLYEGCNEYSTRRKSHSETLLSMTLKVDISIIDKTLNDVSAF